MRFMIIVKASEESEAGIMPTEEELAEMAAYHEQLSRAGVLVDGVGLHPTSKGWRVEYSGTERKVVDGPFSETKELVAGYTLIEVESREEARRWADRFPAPAPGGRGAIEVRQLFALEDFEQGPAIERFRHLEMPAQG